MCEQCDARRAARGEESAIVRYQRIDGWFAGLTRTNRRQGLSLMFDVQLSAMLGLRVGNGIDSDSTPLEIAEAVMDAYLTALETEPRLTTLRIDEYEDEDYFLSDFLPLIH